jgi:hypothetical protein
MPLLAVCFFLSGCETGDETAQLVVTPSDVDVTVTNDTVSLTVTDGLRDLSIPLEWTVRDADLGSIDPAYSGATAVYVSRDKNGINLVTVRDQYGAVGHATINHNYSTSTGGVGGATVSLSANPGQIPVGQNTSTITALSGQPPFTWSVGDASYGGIEQNATNQYMSTYTSLRVGANTVYVTDRDGRTGQITVTQQ